MNTVQSGDMKSFALEWWERIVAGFSHGEPLSVTPFVVVLIVLAAIAVSIPRATWKYFGVFVTVVHELGHAFAALMTGKFVTGIKVRADQSGSTHSFGNGNVLSAIWSGFWGYPTPAVVGAGLIWASINGWSSFALSLSSIILVLTLLFIRNAFGVIVIIGCIAGSALMVLYAPAAVLNWITVSIGIALLVGAVRDLINVISVHTSRREAVGTSDANILYRRTMIPSPVWLVLFAGVIGSSCYVALNAMLAVAI